MVLIKCNIINLILIVDIEIMLSNRRLCNFSINLMTLLHIIMLKRNILELMDCDRFCLSSLTLKVFALFLFIKFKTWFQFYFL